MKNIHILPTDKPSKFCLKITDGFQGFDFHPYNERKLNTWFKPQNIYITSDEEIKEGDWCLYNKTHNSRNPNWELVKCGVIEREEMHPISDGRLLLWMVKIILTTDSDLIAERVQSIPDSFLEWFVKNPSCEYVDLIGLRKEKGYEFLEYEIIIPTEESKQTVQKYNEQGLEKYSYELESKQETVEEAAERISKNHSVYETGQDDFHQGFILGAKWEAERMYSEEDIKQLFESIISEIERRKQNIISNSEIMTPHLLKGGCMAFESSHDVIKEQFEQFKKK